MCVMTCMMTCVTCDMCNVCDDMYDDTCDSVTCVMTYGVLLHASVHCKVSCLIPLLLFSFSVFCLSSYSPELTDPAFVQDFTKCGENKVLCVTCMWCSVFTVFTLHSNRDAELHLHQPLCD